MSSMNPVAVLKRWHDAVNEGDVDSALTECHDDVAVVGPRGTGHGHELMRAWLTRSGIRLQPQEDLIEANGRFVVCEMAHWTTAAAPDGVPLVPTKTWVVFTVEGDKLTSVARYESVADVPPA